MAKLKAAGLTPKIGTPEEFAALVKDEVNKWAPIVKKYNISSD
jgi:tripartite-type tricarboxylate transporter receptor subunit TctC